ncbi:hypothetical protein [Calothrix rhizosoleniae]|uniref:hypothetical protein n=1 Tax=Calothrix rhizosoleniae TaxID=888997 RepID=UPI0011775836|nr:hypothetical protein [Calothrix rhizosoleniae]
MKRGKEGRRERGKEVWEVREVWGDEITNYQPSITNPQLSTTNHQLPTINHHSLTPSLPHKGRFLTFRLKLDLGD